MSHERKIDVAPIGAGFPPDDELRLQINLRLRLDEVAESQALQLQASARRSPDKGELCQLACHLYDSRRERERIMDPALLGEPGWDMLLALYCLPARGEIMTVTSLSHAASVPGSTGLRWQKTLTDEGLIERGPPGVDRRKQMIRLTKGGRELMERYLTRLFYCVTPVPEHVDRAGG